MVTGIGEASKYIFGANHWRNDKLLVEGETRGFKWWIGSYEMPRGITNPTTLWTSNFNVYLAYVDVTGTKLNGITDFEAINSLKINFYNGCTFAGPAENASVLRLSEKIKKDWWVIGEDYLDISWNFSDPELIENPVRFISRHLETETIPSLEKALIMVDLGVQTGNKTLDQMLGLIS